MAGEDAVRIGLITDVHYGHGDRDRLREHLVAARSRFNSADIDAVVNLGDLIAAETMDREACLEALVEIRRLLADALEVPYFEVPGNHDVESLAFEDVAPEAGLELPARTELGDSIIGLFFDSTCPSWPYVPGALGRASIDFLESTLDACEHAVVFSHHPLHLHDQTGGWFEGYPELAYPRDRYWANASIREAGNVLAMVNGHTHLGTAHTFEGIPSVTVRAFNRERPGHDEITGSFGIIEASPDTVRYRRFEDGQPHDIETFTSPS